MSRRPQPLRAVEPATDELAAVARLRDSAFDQDPTATEVPARAPAPAASPAFGPVVLGRSASGSRGAFGGAAEGVFTAPRNGTVVVVASVGGAEGSRGAAAALSCAGSGVERAALLVDVGGRVPRPTLIASASAHRLEERLAARLPTLRPAARGEVCHLSVTADEGGMAAAGVAVTVARGGLAVVHVAPELLQPLMAVSGAPRPDAALLRADLETSRPLVALAVDDLLRRGLRVAVLKRRLGWVAERRAGFGALGSDSGGLPESLLRRLLDVRTRG
jgi:hypothetical protein